MKRATGAASAAGYGTIDEKLKESIFTNLYLRIHENRLYVNIVTSQIQKIYGNLKEILRGAVDAIPTLRVDAIGSNCTYGVG